ncbi:aminotransferase class V-fold PLP-dependent enzyme [Rhodovulum adriaticum]|uniref:Selenocysteine lyase/cysteine desulfurase n=1 Tax=Rhodovulum adriaticum TaxID=35804 RepID=A0A4V6NQG2_RHOAD|nr:aminotransferase class V-fold PLP-dependent enzyme [Rhodovulum adriaticum]MBK1636783.1 nitrogen fixation protein NifS [Rhodovulum adriaticum]TCP21766.1 selenocysteine lyase/cysteine desulfurase [Rhodovulum adriaticum]
MFDTVPGLMDQIRARFAHVDSCPFTGERVFFENAGGALTLNSVVETSAKFAAIPDNQGRANGAAAALMDVIAKARGDMATFFNAPGGQFIVGESGTELLFRLIGAACLGTGAGRVLGSTLEHPASRSAANRYAPLSGKAHVLVAHDDATGSVDAAAYVPDLTPDTQVATILHTSPVTGMGVDIAAIAAEIRKVAPEAYIIVDGIQHAAHGRIDLSACDIDGYVISPYKAFSRHGYGLAWLSDRLAALPHDGLMNAPGAPWELGTRDTGAYATFSDVVAYFDWLGGNFTDSDERRTRIEAAGRAIHAHEARLTEAMLHGTGNLPGLAQIEGISVLGGIDNPRREGLVSFALAGVPAVDIVEKLNAAGIRTHTRKADHYSGNILDPLGLDGCVRVSLCHYNTEEEVARFLAAMRDIAAG